MSEGYYVKRLVWGAPTWVMAVYTCQRWPKGTLLIHEKSGRKLIVHDYEHHGFYVGNMERDGEWLKRYVTFPMYYCLVPSLGEFRMVSEEEVRVP